MFVGWTEILARLLLTAVLTFARHSSELGVGCPLNATWAVQFYLHIFQTQLTFFIRLTTIPLFNYSFTCFTLLFIQLLLFLFISRIQALLRLPRMRQPPLPPLTIQRQSKSPMHV